MKKNTHIVIYILLLAFFAACNDEPAFDLTVSQSDLSLEKGEVVTISIETGNGKYKVESSDNMVAKVLISGTTVAIYGVEGGNAVISIIDELEKTTTIQVSVAYNVPTSPTFTWNKESYSFDKRGGYGISILANSIALTSLTELKQFTFVWDGGLSEGEKTNGELTISRPRMETESQDLEDSFDTIVELVSISVVRSDPVRGYYVVFNDGERGGELFFTR